MDAFSSRANLPAPNNQRPGHAEFRGPGLVAGTLVTTPDGDKKIEDIVAGDLVLSGVGRGKSQFYKVGKVNAKPYFGPTLWVTCNYSDYQLRATPNHICFGCARDDVDDVLNEDGVYVCALNSDEELFRHFVCKANFTEDAEYFYDLDQAEEAARKLSQSMGGAEITRAARFDCRREFQFGLANDLKVGMNLPVIKGDSVVQTRITSIREEHFNGSIYNLNIPQTRNFAANGILVHDSSSAIEPRTE